MKLAEKAQIPNILLVEDNNLDAKRISRSLDQLGYDKVFARAMDGVEALEMLRGEVPGVRLPTPLVILLDLNMPRMNGMEFLCALRADQTLKHLPVYVVTTSDLLREVQATFDLNVGGYFVKPSAAAEMLGILKAMLNFWSAGLLPA